jgi:riboflavin kinase / FMN adenylyltransferase
MTSSLFHLRDPSVLPEPLSRPVVAIGNFDGMHRGHRHVIDRAVTLAASLGKPAALLTFEPHPRAFFQPDKPFFQLTAPDQKARLAHAFGLQGMISLTFDAALAALTAEAFVEDLLVKRLGISGAVVGYDFHFGKGRAGSPDRLADLGQVHGFATAIVTPQSHDGAVVSSTLIRTLLAEGDIARANTMLGHPWTIAGEVMHGDKRGRELGYPTANMILAKGITLKHGIYAVRAEVNGTTHAGVASFGRRPTFDDGAPRLEVHLFDFTGDLYGKMMQVAFIGYIRPELKFDGAEPLIRQMGEDSRTARAMLAAA